MTFAIDLPASSTQTAAITSDPLQTASGVYVTVHGHFYQPPRENPYLDTIERQPSATPFHDWNERINYECYRPNAFARVVNERGEIAGIVNNYEYLSFNIGPTLMSWLERHDLEVYQQILAADRKSCDRLNGHGNAIAQVYNHIIMPLANQRDKYTQIRWGKEDFRSRFGRDPEGMWLAETAVDYPTLEALIAEGIRFIVLAPSQAQRCRPIPTEEGLEDEWIEVGGSQIDPTRPYRCFLPNGNPEKDFIDIWFYDGPISRDMGFSDVLFNSQHLAGRIGQAVRGDRRASQLISVATDGETFGHHKGGTEKTLAYAFTVEFPQRGWTVSNYAHYLSLQPPTWEVELKPVTAWSCSHGVDRWQDDCGCGGGGLWHQKWRKPLRHALDWLRDRLIEVYEEAGSKLFLDPWQARDEYIRVIRDRSVANVEHFLTRHRVRKLTSAEQVDALRLLEMQRHALLMYTSCGWFFEELSRPEGVQVLRYAARALELAGEVTGVQLEKGFIKRLALAPSNIESFQHGSQVYHQLVVPAQISLKLVAAEYAISSLFANGKKNLTPQPPVATKEGGQTISPLPPHPALSYKERGAAVSFTGEGNTRGEGERLEDRVYCYEVQQLDYKLQRMGVLTLAVGQLRLVSEVTWESAHLVFAVLHLGGWDFHCCIQPFTGRGAYSRLKEQLFEVLPQASAAKTILAMNEFFGDRYFSLPDLSADERHRLMRSLTQETLTRLDRLYTQVYRDNYGVLMAFHRDELPVPQELQVAAEIALSDRCLTALRGLEQDSALEVPNGWNHLAELEAIATEANHLRCQLKIPEAKQLLEQIIWRSLFALLQDPTPARLEPEVQRLGKLIDAGQQLKLGLALDRCQEMLFNYLRAQETTANSGEPGDLRQLLLLGEKLGVAID